jgi:hypothetical protein
MSEESTPSSDGPADLTRLWLDMASQATQACQAWAGAAASPETFRQGRSDLYKVWSDSWERFLRSAPFLEMNKQYTGSSAECQRQVRECLRRWNRELQLPSSEDIDQLLISVRRLGEELREHFDQVEERLSEIATRLDALAARLGTVEKGVPGNHG